MGSVVFSTYFFVAQPANRVAPSSRVMVSRVFIALSSLLYRTRSRYLPQDREKSWKRYRGRICVIDSRFGVSPQSGNREGHSYTVVAERVECGRTKMLAARHSQAIRAGFGCDPHAAEVLYYRGDAVGFLYA